MSGSYQSGMAVDRPAGTSESDGQEFIGYWTNAILSDVHRDLNDYRSGDEAQIAPKAAAWFREAWASAGPLGRRYRVTWFVLRFFDQPNQSGNVLAEIDVLTGEFWSAA